MNRPKNLRLELEPYPHLRDDDGTVLANDYVNLEKMRFITHTINGLTEPKKEARPDGKE